MIGSASKRTVAILAAASLLSAGGAAVWFSDLAPVDASAKSPSLLSMLRDRSPGDRAKGAASSKKAPVSAVLAERTPAAKMRPAVAPVALASPAAVTPAVAGAAVPVPLAAAPLAAAAPALLPAAATGSSLFVPPLFLPGGGGGSSLIIRTVTPPGGGPPPVPGVPEPQSWAMMILGFGFIGALLRRRRRLAGGSLAPTLATAASGR